MRKIKELATAALFMTIALAHNSAKAQEIGFGGIEVGTTACDEAFAEAEKNGDVTQRFTSAITDSDAISLGRHAFGFDFVQDGIIVCGLDKTVSAIAITIPKDRANEIADALANKYSQKSRNLPGLGSGLARFASKTGRTTAEISYVHVSFTADLVIETSQFAKMFADYQNKKKSEAKAKTQSAF
jgi:hypothetical protein